MFLLQIAKHLSHTYGNKAPEVAKLANITGRRWPVVGKRLLEQFPYIEAEIKYAVQEYACTVVDFLARRTRLAFLNAQAAADAIPKIADIMAKELKWSKAKKEVTDEFSWEIGFCIAREFQSGEAEVTSICHPMFVAYSDVIYASVRQ